MCFTWGKTLQTKKNNRGIKKKTERKGNATNIKRKEKGDELLKLVKRRKKKK